MDDTLFIATLVNDVDAEIHEQTGVHLSWLTRLSLTSAIYDTVISRRVEVVGIEHDSEAQRVDMTLRIKLPAFHISVNVSEEKELCHD
jgi:hypothetical protein